MPGLIEAIVYVDPKSITLEEIEACKIAGLEPHTGNIAVKRIFNCALLVSAVDTKDIYTCEKHGNVDGFFRVYGKEFCGKCAAEAIKKFIEREVKNE